MQTTEREHTIVHNGFSPLVTTPGLFLCIVAEHSKYGPTHYAVHMRHGSPAGQFWKNGGAISRFKTISEARDLVDHLAGLKDAHKQFPIVNVNY